MDYCVINYVYSPIISRLGIQKMSCEIKKVFAGSVPNSSCFILYNSQICSGRVYSAKKESSKLDHYITWKTCYLQLERILVICSFIGG